MAASAFIARLNLYINYQRIVEVVSKNVYSFIRTLKILIIFEGVVVEYVTWFTKVSLKGHEDNYPTSKVKDQYK